MNICEFWGLYYKHKNANCEMVEEEEERAGGAWAPGVTRPGRAAENKEQVLWCQCPSSDQTKFQVTFDWLTCSI